MELEPSPLEFAQRIYSNVHQCGDSALDGDEGSARGAAAQGLSLCDHHGSHLANQQQSPLYLKKAAEVVVAGYVALILVAAAAVHMRYHFRQTWGLVAIDPVGVLQRSWQIRHRVPSGGRSACCRDQA